MMEIITSLEQSAGARGAVLAIGNFDGVHRGHRKLIDAARAIAEDKGCRLAVLSFEPHPRNVFRPDDPPFRLTPPAVKQRRLAACGVDCLVSLTFDWDFASQSAADFIERVLVQSLAPAAIVVGSDFCFGQLRKGTPQTLRDAGLAVTILDKIGDEADGAISSSAIRTALRQGNVRLANRLLGWEWEIEGEVVGGDRRGRTIGYPTANVRLGETLHPAYGVYATLVQIEGEGEDFWRPAATNIGIRPMFALPVGQVEAHILDFEGDIYGRTLRVRPVKKLRGEAKYESLEALVAQIGADCAQTREILAAATP